MNIYTSLNEITNYIDINIENKIDYNILAKFLGVNKYTMQRIFSLITGVSLADYIRKRRLSLAASDLYNKKGKIMDIALKYGYENATSFARAFESFHGIKPSQIAIGNFKNYPKITFKEEIFSPQEVKYNIIETEEMTLYGLKKKTSNATIENDAPSFFKEVLKKYLNTLGEPLYAMVEYDNEQRTNCTNYCILYKKRHEDFEKVIIPASKWLVFRIDSQEAKDIHESSQNFYLSFLPSCKYNLKAIPELEYYHDGITDFMVPIY